MSNLAAVVALLALGTVTRHVTVSTARVASLATLVTAAVVVVVRVTTIASLGVATSFRAVSSNVANLGALVAFLAGTRVVSATATSGTFDSWVGAITGDVASLTAFVASLVLRTLRALSAHVSLATAIVALGWATSRAVASLVRSIATVVATTSLSTTGIFHG